MRFAAFITGICLLLCFPVFGDIPSTPYATAARTAVGTLTDFTSFVDLADMPAEWWALVDTSDGTKGRVFKEDGTELAADWISFDDGASTGGLRALWSGTFSAVTPNTIRIYPPLAARASYAAGDTYGQYNAYDADWKLYLPLHDLSDRTSNGIDGTGQGGITVGGAVGKVGAATNFVAASNEYISFGDVAMFDGATEMSWSGWIKRDRDVDNEPFFSKWDHQVSTTFMLDFRASGSILKGRLFIASTLDDNGSHHGDISVVVPSDVNYHFITVVFDGAGATNSDRLKFFLDDVEDAGMSFTGSIPTSLLNSSVDLTLGQTTSLNREFDGQKDDVQIHSSKRSDDWRKEEYLATFDPEVYWGVWDFVEVGRVNLFGGGRTVSGLYEGLVR